MKKINFIKGFTLIELLVVMSIIAILASIMYGPFQTARRRARDTQAIQDMRTLQNYIALYADDHQGNYPLCLDVLASYGSIPARSATTDGDAASCGTAVPTGDLTRYNYVPLKDAYDNVYGYHLWTKLNDINDALRTDVDCDSTNLTTNSCWPVGLTVQGGVPKKGFSGTDSTLDGFGTSEPSVDICKQGDTCILDYKN